MEKEQQLKFIDLFAGIGGFRLGLESVGAKCVFSSEIDSHAIEIYKENFGDNPENDITTLNPKLIPDFDILCGGFPCQSFSICGKQEGFNDIRGTLFFDICRILEEKKPKVFILENVQNLENHDKGNTLFVMIKTLNELGYSVSYKVLNARNFGVPQNRERIIIIGNREGKFFDFEKLRLNTITSMYPFLQKEGEFEFLSSDEYTLLKENQIKVQSKSGLIFAGYRNKKIRVTGVKEDTEHLSRVHKQPNRIYSALGTHPTLASQEQSGRYWILVDGKVRKLTLEECFKFMGFPDDYKKIGLKSKLYQRIGNSICVNMVKEIAREVVNQFWGDGEKVEDSVIEYLKELYEDAKTIVNLDELKLTKEQKEWVENLVNKEETFKGVYTVLVTSLVYKKLNPNQDVRYHQVSLENGYSGRSFDTKYITPFLKNKQFLGAMKESGWLTRSLEQNLPYDLNYPGKIQSSILKESFLKILEDIEENGANPHEYLLGIFSKSIKEKEKKLVKLVNPIIAESKLTINQIMSLLEKHFYYGYKSRGASVLPVLALYSLYQCLIKETKRFEGKELQELSSHNSCDRSSGNTGDIVIKNQDNSLYEVIEVKFDIKINKMMIEDAYKKFGETSVQRYYILSTSGVEGSEEEIHELIDYIRREHGCEVIINGVFPTIYYFLRLLQNTNDFINAYVENVEKNLEINFEHRMAWNIIQNL